MRSNSSFDIAVIGASFAGLACARAAARRGASVVVLDRKSDAGEKLHTTGIIVRDAIEDYPGFRDLPTHLTRRIDAVRLYAPNLGSMRLTSPGYYFLATDTPGLMRHHAIEAQREGVTLRMNTAFVGGHRVEERIELDCGIDVRYLVGADGPKSRVAEAFGLERNREFLFGIEHEYAGATLPEHDALHCFIDRALAPGYIGWALQGVGQLQLGLARRSPGGTDIAGFTDKVRNVLTIGTQPPAGVRAGLIPCGGTLTRVALPGVLLVGDAAGLVSPVTAGGIHTAVRHGDAAGAAIADFLRGQADDPAQWFPATYPRFRAKRFLRWGFDLFQADWIFNLMLRSWPMRRAVETIYFHRRRVKDVEGTRRANQKEAG
jgi:digeranylgeranylglycerophospholipid reductase